MLTGVVIDAGGFDMGAPLIVRISMEYSWTVAAAGKAGKNMPKTMTRATRENSTFFI
jgi:hypothetical protein